MKFQDTSEGVSFFKIGDIKLWNSKQEKYTMTKTYQEIQTIRENSALRQLVVENGDYLPVLLMELRDAVGYDKMCYAARVRIERLLDEHGLDITPGLNGNQQTVVILYTQGSEVGKLLSGTYRNNGDYERQILRRAHLRYAMRGHNWPMK